VAEGVAVTSAEAAVAATQRIAVLRTVLAAVEAVAHRMSSQAQRM
jgi:hypothetical protein